jgi:DNA invertase Pin-like site-specific DNA recombinase
MKFVAYYRVSTKKQGESGLGLDAQRSMVESYVKDGSAILREFIEIESGKNNNRPRLLEALAFAREHAATLLIAKLDRLSRNIAFIFSLKDSGVNFVCVDMPEANTLTIGILASMAQYERELISQRTRSALQEKKKKGFQLGFPANFTQASRQQGAAAMREKSKRNDNNRRAYEAIRVMKGEGKGWTSIADRLNLYGFRTAEGKRFFPTQVKRIYERFS